MKTTYSLASMGVVLILLSGSTLAQSTSTQDTEKGESRKSTQKDSQEQNQGSSQQSFGGKQSSGDSQSKYRIKPAGWIQMAVDYDNDGMFDGIETIYAYDFEKARKSSQERANREAQKMSREQSRDQVRHSEPMRNSNDSNQASQSGETVSGQVLQLRDEQIMGMDEPCVVARIRKGNNMPAKVVLGPKSNVDSWELAEGDQITVNGRKGRINDRPVLLASKVSWEGKSKQVDLPSSRNSKRVKAEVQSLRTTQFRGRDGKFVVAKVKSQSGKTCEVNLGAKSKVDQLNLSEGDQLSMIVRPARVNGKPGMVADELNANGKSVNVSPPNRMDRRDRNQNQTSRSKSEDSKSGSSADEAALGVAVGETGEGVVVIGIHPNSPVADEDLQIGDAIVSIDGKKVGSASDLVEMIRNMKPGKTVKLEMKRDGERSTVQAKLANRQKLMQVYR